MAKQRIVNTRFWDDSYIARLSPNEKLIFLYLLTSPLTTIAGAYELSAKRASFDVGLSIKEVGKVFEKLESDEKIIREGDWVGIVNFIKYQTLNPKVKRGIQIELENAPQALVERLNVDFDILSQPMDRLSHSNSNLNSKRNSNTTPNEPGGREFSTAFAQERQDLTGRMRFGN